jgi:hypothetical protein
MMTIEEYKKLLDKRVKSLERSITTQLLPRMGVEAVNHFKNNFYTQSFDGKKWKDVKRRDSNSPWYGFEYKGERRTSYSFTRGKNGKTSKSKTQRKLNFSVAATKRPILTGATGELGNSLNYHTRGLLVRVYTPKKYGKVQNEGGIIKVFGKATKRLPARPFVGKSKILIEQNLKPMAKKFITQQLTK